MTQTAATCVGKHPSHGDFIRWNHERVPEGVELDRWVQAGLERCYAEHGRGFDARLRALPPSFVLFTSPTTRRVLAGVLTASADRVGRAYPLLLGWQLGAEAPGPGFDRLPVAVAASLRAAHDLVAARPQADALQGFLERANALSWARRDAEASADFASYLERATLDTVWNGWPGFDAAERRVAFLDELRQATRGPFPPRYVLAMPSSGAAVETAFWLLLVRQWLPAPRNPTLVLWPADGRQGFARLLFDDLHPRYFEGAMWPAAASDHAIDFARALARPGPAPATEILARILRPGALLQDVAQQAAAT